MHDDVYRKLGKHLAALGMGYPDKEELMDILQANFSPFEAEVALAIPTGVIPLELARRSHRRRHGPPCGGNSPRPGEPCPPGAAFSGKLDTERADMPSTSSDTDSRKPSSGAELIRRTPKPWRK